MVTRDFMRSLRSRRLKVIWAQQRTVRARERHAPIFLAPYYLLRKRFDRGGKTIFMASQADVPSRLSACIRRAHTVNCFL